jgi:hypothetical protein
VLGISAARSAASQSRNQRAVRRWASAGTRPGFTKLLGDSKAILSPRRLDAGMRLFVAMSHPRFKALALAAAAALAACLTLASCGGPSSNRNAASTEQSDETKLADYARCMREHGFNAEVATLPGGGHGLKIGGSKAGTPGPGESEAAEKACARYRPQPQTVNLSPQQKVEREESVGKFAKCMREHGIQVEASATNGNVRILLHGHPGSGGPNPESPGFQRAQSTCQKLLPKPGPG